MTAILDRTDENKTRKGRLAQLKRGPGVFVYDGGLFDTESEPTPLFKNGEPVLDHSGKQMLGGVPNLRQIPVDTFVLMGVEFPKGVPVEVKLSALALKLRGMDHFVEQDEAAPVVEAAPIVEEETKRGRPRKAVES
jgi:hypothetical protein